MEDFLALALGVDQDTFIDRCQHPLLLAVNEPGPSLAEDPFPSETTQSYGRIPQAVEAAPTGRALYPVLKMRPIIPHAIIVGRAPMSDIVIHDKSVSKAHAMFQESNRHYWMLSDIGSANGTHVNHTRLQPRGESVRVKLGDVISFAFRTYFFLDAGTAWDKLRR